MIVTRSTFAVLVLSTLGFHVSVEAQWSQAGEPVEFWSGARPSADENGWRLDLGDAWVPPILDDGLDARGRVVSNEFASVFRALAREEWPNGDLGERARRDRFLENYGIPPALSVLRARMRMLRDAACVDDLDLQGLALFAGLAIDEDEPHAPTMATDEALEARLTALLVRYDVGNVSMLSTRASQRELRELEGWLTEMHWRRGLAAVRARLVCSGDLASPASTRRELDARTRRALERFERRHRIRSRGGLSGDTMRALRIDPRELARRDLVRVITERLRLERGILEDGSADGGDLIAEVGAHVVESFGLQSFESAMSFLESLGPLEANDHRWVSIEPVDLPAHYDEQDLELEVEIDRGDVWFDPPFDADGHARVLPVERRPTLTLFVRTSAGRTALVRWPTTIGGWRQEVVQGGATEWRYKESPAGSFAWDRIVSAPVWLPPPSTPTADLVTQRRVDEEGNVETELRTTLLGPGYASAYGLVVANHRAAVVRRNGRIRLGRDDGIRTHGSVDYTSVWRRASHGCHRLENHRALAMFSFILRHRAHQREGHARVRFDRTVQTTQRRLQLRIDRGGYGFRLARPVPVVVLPGRILGTLREAPTSGLPVSRTDDGDAS